MDRALELLAEFWIPSLIMSAAFVWQSRHLFPLQMESLPISSLADWLRESICRFKPPVSAFYHTVFPTRISWCISSSSAPHCRFGLFCRLGAGHMHCSANRHTHKKKRFSQQKTKISSSTFYLQLIALVFLCVCNWPLHVVRLCGRPPEWNIRPNRLVRIQEKVTLFYKINE